MLKPGPMNGVIVQSANFEFLRSRWPELADLGGFAEHYAWSDPASALVKLRSLAESMIQRLYDEHRLAKPPSSSLYDLLDNHQFKAAIPPVVINAFHLIRKLGNKAAHGQGYPAEKALGALRDAFDLGRWFYLVSGGRQSDFPIYAPPPQPSEIQAQTAAMQARLASQELAIQTLLAELEAARLQHVTAERKIDELQGLMTSGRQAADVLGFDEATTRERLIDSELVAAGWRFQATPEATAEITVEYEVKHQPTPTGLGYADYVLWDDDGKPLAVIEAKKTSKSAELGKKQAELYADGLEKTFGLRPAIFYTNGYDIFFWDDSQGDVPRRLYGFYSKDSLQYLVRFQRHQRKELSQVPVRKDIVDRLYQIEAIRRVAEKFASRRRKALVVQATGTGKTRVAIALTDLLLRASWVKRVLFLCDRKELRKQAKNAFTEFINEPLTVVRADTAKDRDKRVYLATYPAMNKIFQSFDVGFFDLIIADESHRSIYNRYRDLFRYFDCLQVGLTATPVDFIGRNTFKMFDCEYQHPTAYYPLSQAVDEKKLVPFEVYTHTTQFLRQGIKYKDLSEDQRRQLEEDGEDPALFDYENTQIDKQVFNRDTNRAIIRILMENGLRDATGTCPGKSIIFARNHHHAVLLAEVFDELYPQYGGKFCRVIDNYDPRAEQLIDDFKAGPETDPRIAISVDMLDTGIDVPEIVNLVFAKPIRSLVKFEQMIGRGTRLCADLFGPGKDKSAFYIFDHWGNFAFFGKEYQKAQPSVSKSLMQQLFEARIDLARCALNAGEPKIFEQAALLLKEDLERLSEETISVREKWREKRTLSRLEVLTRFDPATEQALRRHMAPLMQWADIRGQIEAYRFDLLVSELEIARLKKTGRWKDLKSQVVDQVSRLPMHLNPVREKSDTIKAVKSPSFWKNATFQELETLRNDLRGIMHYMAKTRFQASAPKFIDVEDGQERYQRLPVPLGVEEMAGYRKKILDALESVFAENPTLQKIKCGESVTQADLKALTSLVLTQNPGVDQELLREFFQNTTGPLDQAIRAITGMDAAAVERRFADFVAGHCELSANQIAFLNLLKNHISRYGSIRVEQLYEPPFTTLHSEGLDGLFHEERLATELLGIVKSFQPEVSQ